jgi:hypothetical protein
MGFRIGGPSRPLFQKLSEIFKLSRIDGYLPLALLAGVVDLLADGSPFAPLH